MANSIENSLSPVGENTGNNSDTLTRESNVGGSDPKLPLNTNYCLCSGCGRYFGGVNGFERHRVNFQCVDPAAVGLTLNDQGYWVRKPPKIGRIRGGKTKLDDFSNQAASNSTGGDL